MPILSDIRPHISDILNYLVCPTNNLIPRRLLLTQTTVFIHTSIYSINTVYHDAIRGVGRGRRGVYIGTVSSKYFKYWATTLLLFPTREESMFLFILCYLFLFHFPSFRSWSSCSQDAIRDSKRWLQSDCFDCIRTYSRDQFLGIKTN